MDRLKLKFSVKIFRLGKERRTVKASKFPKAQKAFNQYALGGLRCAIVVVFSRLGILLPHYHFYRSRRRCSAASLPRSSLAARSRQVWTTDAQSTPSVGLIASVRWSKRRGPFGDVLDCLDAQGCGRVGLSGARTADQHNILGIIQEPAFVQLAQGACMLGTLDHSPKLASRTGVLLRY